MTEIRRLYRRVDGSTNFQQVSDPTTIKPEEWRANGASGGKNLVWLTARKESFSAELSGLEVNELAGRIVVRENDNV